MKTEPNNDLSNRISIVETKLTSIQQQLSTTKTQITVGSKSDSSNKLSSSDQIASAAAFIALCAFFVAIWQGYISRKHNRLSVRPKLDIHTLCIDNEPIVIELRNYGLGPAIVKDIKYEIGGNKFKSDKTDSLVNFTNYFKQPINVGAIRFYTIHDQTIINQNNSISLLVFEDSHNDNTYIADICSKLNDLKIEVSYDCIYGNKYNMQTSSVL